MKMKLVIITIKINFFYRLLNFIIFFDFYISSTKTFSNFLIDIKFYN